MQLLTNRAYRRPILALLLFLSASCGRIDFEVLPLNPERSESDPFPFDDTNDEPFTDTVIDSEDGADTDSGSDTPDGSDDVDTVSDSEVESSDLADTETDIPNVTDIETDIETDTGVEECPVVPGGTNVHEVSAVVSHSQDDAEEAVIGNATYQPGNTYTDSSDLEMTNDVEYHGPQQIIGLRFPALQVPQGAVIQEAHVEFVADYTNNESTHLLLTVEASDNAASFTSGSFNISSRPRVTATINWTNVSPWTVDNIYPTPDLSAAIQEVVCRDGWTSGNAMVVIVEGTGIREAVSYDQTPADAATLHVTYRY